MASQAQIKANQENAQKFTGPPSIEGIVKSILLLCWIKKYRGAYYAI
jgi:hypothetical protein